MTSYYTWSVTASDNDDADSAINWRELQEPDTVNNSARAMMQRGAEWRLDMSSVRVTTGAANAYEMTIQSSPAALVDGMLFSFRAHQANTGAATLKVNTFTAKPLRVISGSNLSSGEIQANQFYFAVYNLAADEFLLVNSGGISQGSSPSFGNLTVQTLTATSAITNSGGPLTVGANDTTPGEITVYGGAAGENGASLKLYNAADHDTSTEYYGIEPDANGDLRIGRNAVSDVVVARGTGNVYLALASGEVFAGNDDDTRGLITIQGGGAGELGGGLRWKLPADDDATAAGEYFEAVVDGGLWTLQRADGTDAIVVQADCVPRFPRVANAMLCVGDNGVLVTNLKTATDVTGSRAANTAYQNTTGKPLFVTIAVAATNSRDIQISSDNFVASNITIGRIGNNGITESFGFWVPDNWYYRINGGVQALTAWVEYS